MIEHYAEAKIRKNGGTYNVTLPKHIANMLDLQGTEKIRWNMIQYDDGIVELQAIMLWE